MIELERDSYEDSMSAIHILIGKRFHDWWRFKIGMFHPFFYKWHWN